MSNPARRLISVLLLFGLAAGPLRAQNTAAVSLLDDVKYLASDSLGGRLMGTSGAEAAAAYIARRFKQVGLRPTPKGWYQEFTIGNAGSNAAGASMAGVTGKNVIGVLPGKDGRLRDEIVIVGAHYDHLGLGKFGSLDPDSTGRIHNGADDNASGTSALIYIAQRLRASPPARTVVFIAFSGEEAGLLGSAYYVKRPVYPLSSTYAMINMDMVGRLRNDRLLIYGTATAAQFPAILDSLNAVSHFDLKLTGDGWGRSDQSSFYAAGKPVLHLFTDLHEDYHRTTDDWEKINADGLARVADFTASIVRTLASRRDSLTFVSVPLPRTASGSGSGPGNGAYLGTVPDMADNSTGVRLTGVRAGSPAEKAGIMGNDILVQIGDRPIVDLQGMTDALRAYKPGDVVEIRVLRDGVEKRLTATLGTRGG